MEENNRFGRRGLYKPKVMTQEDIDNSLKKALKGSKKTTINPGTKGKMGYRPPTMKPREEHSQIRGQQPQRQPIWEPNRATPLMQPSQQEPEPYWSAQEWEQWAFDLLTQYPETKKFLPSWFIEAVNNS